MVFPQFSDRGPLPKHGLARDRAWELDTGSDGAPVARVACRLRDDDLTRRVWPHRFTLTLVAEASGDQLTMTLGVRNEAPEDGEPFTFTAALHAYLAAEVPVARLRGLAEHPAQDHTRGGTSIRLPREPLPARGPLDVAVPGARGPVHLRNGVDDELEISCTRGDGFDSLVVWNPGEHHGLGTSRPRAPGSSSAWPARLTPVTLAPQGVWRGTARFTALVPSP